MTTANIIKQFRILNWIVARKAKCSHCGTKGAVDFRLHYVCKIQGND